MRIKIKENFSKNRRKIKAKTAENPMNTRKNGQMNFYEKGLDFMCISLYDTNAPRKGVPY